MPKKVNGIPNDALRLFRHRELEVRRSPPVSPHFEDGALFSDIFDAVVAWAGAQNGASGDDSPAAASAGAGAAEEGARVPVDAVLRALNTRGGGGAAAAGGSVFPNDRGNPNSLRARTERSPWLRPLLRVPPVCVCARVCARSRVCVLCTVRA